MTTPADQLREVLTRLSNDHRRTVAYYGNVEGRPGAERVPRRLLSDFGFLDNAQFTYVVPAPAHVDRGEDARACTTITVHPYGVREDHARLTSRAAVDRRVRTAPSADATNGVVPLAVNPLYLVSGELDAATVAPTKTRRLVERLVDPRRGPAYHFVLSRDGHLYVGAALDDTTSASTTDAETTIDVAVETALALLRTDHEGRRYTQLVELPYTEAQVTQLAILVAKLRTAYAQVPLAVGATGVRVQWPSASFPGTAAYNLTASHPTSPLDYAATTPETFVARVGRQGPFDLATQIFRPRQAPAPIATRAVARTAIANIDTVGEQAVALGNYPALAGAERSSDMQATPRNRFFVQRINVAHADSDHAGGAAAETAAAGDSATNTPSPATDTGPHTYDFGTGFWGDGEPF